MTFQVRVERRPNSFGLDDRVWVLDDGADAIAEVAPALGFNCYRWHVPVGELFYADPKFFEENKPTRSGFPILFPFPNRICDGRFTWTGRQYQLPANDPTGKNAIHGFVCRKPWRVVDQGSGAGAAWVTGEFIGSRDAAESLKLWPADYRIAVTCRLERNALVVHAEIANPDTRDLPLGLGYHPYFAIAPFDGSEAQIAVPAREFWELADSLPTGSRRPVDGQRDLRAGRRLQDLQLDDVLTDLDRSAPNDDLTPAGRVGHGNRRLEMYVSDVFREIVAFTPPHRQAVCLEPYTCATDAINLEQRGVDAGWRVLRPRAILTATVRLTYRDSSERTYAPL
jgi:aldose 1-epimerase